jgi:proteasome assembly chaperone (PAC2) family protein
VNYNGRRRWSTMPGHKKENRVLEFVTEPMMLAAWPGPGKVGQVALEYLRSEIKAEPLERIDMSALYSPSSISIKEGKFIQPAIPEGEYYFKRNPPLIILECDTHLAEKESFFLVHNIVNTAVQWGVSRIITVGGMPSIMDHKGRSEVRFAASDEALARDLKTAGFSPIPGGEIAGPVGLVPSVAALHGVKAACILATMPVYASAIMYPKASLALLWGIERLLQVRLDHRPLELIIERMEEVYAHVEEEIRERFPADLIPESAPLEEAEEEQPSAAREPPGPVMAKIEQLFREAARDRSIAVELKKELDRQGIFKEYEDRFLDLFKEPEEGK